MHFDNTNFGLYSGVLVLIGIVLINSYNYFKSGFLIILGFLAVFLSLLFAFQAVFSIFKTINK